MAEQSMSDRLRGKVQGVVANASNYPRRVQPYILGQDIGPLAGAIVDAILPLIEEAVTAERERCAGIAESNLGRRWVARETVGDIAAAIRADREPEPATEEGGSRG